MKQIVFTHSGHSAIFGSFSSGDLMRLPDDAARHFVEEAGCAQYATKDVPPVPKDDVAEDALPAPAKGAKKSVAPAKE